jgi:Zn-dependent protease with chaperone function
MVNLAMRSVAVLGVLFGLLFAVLIGALHAAQPELPAGVALSLALAIAIGISALQFAISPYILQWILKINWVEPEMVDAKLGANLRRLCLEKRLPVPRFGIIEDGNPNAFTFGHWPSDARLVVTRGLLHVCDERETEAVVAHELGHIAHWDFVVMTVAATVPLVLYVIWRFGVRAGRGRGKSAGAILLVALGAFIAYIISEYVVLFLSRVREYYADQFSAEATRSPNALAGALVKIAYGLARAEPAAAAVKEKKQSLVVAGGAKMIGIFDPKYGGSMALASAGGYSADTRTYDPATATRAMRWDIWNPWALIAELSSSHPLPAKRIRHLQALSQQVGERPDFDLPDRQPESYWDEFATDLFFNYLPILGFLVAGGATLAATGIQQAAWLLAGAAAVGGWAICNLIRLGFAYPKGRFESGEVAELVGEVKVSNIRCRPVTLRGTVIGRGIPGLYWSEDLVIQDPTGFMVMDYRQPLRILEFLFGLFRADSFVGQQVVAQGWYRRYPVPYLELWKVQLPDGTTHTCHNWAAKFWSTIVIGVVAGFGCLLGIGMLLGG